jgi:hypothetical protein
VAQWFQQTASATDQQTSTTAAMTRIAGETVVLAFIGRNLADALITVNDDRNGNSLQ